jgi:hypothetical protein
MTSIVRVASTDYATTGDTSYEFFGPFRDDGKADEFAAAINARVDGSNHDQGFVQAEAFLLASPKINAIVREAKAWLKAQAE